MRFRRVVTATSDEGRSYVLIDGAAGVVYPQPGRGLTFHELWMTDGPLASNEGVEDCGARPVRHQPPAGGSLFRIVELEPDERRSADEVASEFGAMGAAGSVLAGREPGMHRNETIDYNVVIEGEMFAVTDSEEILLTRGDCLIQRGTAHTWHNRSNVTCVFASIMVSALPITYFAMAKDAASEVER